MDYRLPELGEGVQEAEMIRWLVDEGDEIQRDQPLAEVMTDKAVVELPAPFAGRITSLLAAVGDTILIDEPLLSYDPPAEDASAADESKHARTDPAAAKPAAPPHAAAATPPQRGAPDTPARRPAAPAVRRMARSLDIDLQEVSGSGPDGRVLIEDLADRVRTTAIRDAVVTPAPDSGGGSAEPGSRLPLRGLRRKVAERMSHARQTIPHYAYVDECDVSRLVQRREALRQSMAAAGVRLTFLPFFVKAVCQALKEAPLVNSSLDQQREEIVLHNRYHIGIAIATPQGLIVPVLRDADRMSLEQIAREIQRLSDEARSQRTRREDLGGGTFTITSIGGIGGLISTPIINEPEVGILGVGRITKRPVCEPSGAIRAAEMVFLSFSFDHRVVDGAVGAEFGNAVIRSLQDF